MYYIPAIIISDTCKNLGINEIDFTIYNIDLNFYEKYKDKVIKYYFEKLIKIIENDSFDVFKLEKNKNE